MPMCRRLLSHFFQLGALLLAPAWAFAVDTPEQAAVRKAMMATWDKSEARLEVGPIVIHLGRTFRRGMDPRRVRWP